MFIAAPDVDDFQFHLNRSPFKPGQFLLLCTDGLYETLSPSDMAQAITSDLPGSLELLYKAARNSGATDDISMIVLHLST